MAGQGGAAALALVSHSRAKEGKIYSSIKVNVRTAGLAAALIPPLSIIFASRSLCGKVEMKIYVFEIFSTNGQ